jgi:hypothetical protein
MYLEAVLKLSRICRFEAGSARVSFHQLGVNPCKNYAASVQLFRNRKIKDDRGTCWRKILDANPASQPGYDIARHREAQTGA